MKWSVLGIVLGLLLLPVIAIAALAPEGWMMTAAVGALVLTQLAAMLCFVLAERGHVHDNDKNGSTP